MSDTKSKRTLTGIVTSDKMDQTIVVSVVNKRKHPLYNKYVAYTTKLHVHDPENQCKEGDRVTIGGCRPLSKTKSWMLIEVHNQ